MAHRANKTAVLLPSIASGTRSEWPMVAMGHSRVIVACDPSLALKSM
jgi:hypothetical protein